MSDLLCFRKKSRLGFIPALLLTLWDHKQAAQLPWCSVSLSVWWLEHLFLMGWLWRLNAQSVETAEPAQWSHGWVRLWERSCSHSPTRNQEGPSPCLVSQWLSQSGTAKRWPWIIFLTNLEKVSVTKLPEPRCFWQASWNHWRTQLTANSFCWFIH